ncbi:hypothetical protein N7533_001057 [Penicillium manginii]|uniref:uncharacterized protein n=1 Tax=Penicillium manginii TaxID=203109 RepID=UPI002548144D|nr:uncharacterized protein N7533_001057 [Penicillium manginii]KAJ5768474.1 hypothetical protein N7533_001057 [Penicillium manginii]
MTSKFPSSDHYRAEVAQMEDDADTHNHQNDIGGGAADMYEHDYCASIAQSTQVSWSAFTHDFTQGKGQLGFCV